LLVFLLDGAQAGLLSEAQHLVHEDAGFALVEALPVVFGYLGFQDPAGINSVRVIEDNGVLRFCASDCHGV